MCAFVSPALQRDSSFQHTSSQLEMSLRSDGTFIDQKSAFYFSLSLFSVGVNCVRRVKLQTVTQPKWSQFTRTIKRLIFLTRFPLAPSPIPFCNNHMIMLISCILVLALLPRASTATSLDEHMKHPNQKHAQDSREQKCVTKCLSHDVSTNSVDGDTTQFPETWRRRPKRFCAATRDTCHMHLERTPRSDTGGSSGNLARIDNLTRSVVTKCF